MKIPAWIFCSFPFLEEALPSANDFGRVVHLDYSHSQALGRAVHRHVKMALALYSWNLPHGRSEQML